ncbi:MAG: Uma2 family endonuclease [Microscillaceae bacterium]|nr:Uma2 family endonuclease [Microscillaceae bacterium]
MLDVVKMGVNAPKEHQRIIRKLTTGLDIMYTQQQILYEPLPETMVDESQTSATPDVLLFDNQTQKNIIIIEVTIPASEKKDFQKLQEIVDDYEIPEGFLYNYKTQQWRKYKFGQGEVIDKPSFCDSIQVDLNSFL